MKQAIPTFDLEQINDRQSSLKDVFFTDTKLQILENTLNKPYRSNYYGVGLCISGTATVIGNLNSYEVLPNTIIAMSPQVIKQWTNVSADFETVTIFFTKAFFTKSFPGPLYLEQFQFFDQNAKLVNLISAASSTGITKLFEKIKSVIGIQHPYQNEIVASYINILLYSYKAIFEQVHASSQIGQSRNQQIVHAFKDLVNKHFRKERSVQFYADQLFISPKHLTDIVKQETGKPSSDWINEMLLLEAKVLLNNPQLQVTQIAGALHFSDASTFGKFFKKLTGISPVQYRRR